VTLALSAARLLQALIRCFPVVANSGDGMSDQAWTGLAEAITAIRAELAAAVASDAGLRFRAGPVELEFSIDVHTDIDGNVKVRLFPGLGVEARAAHSADTAHRLKVTLQPVEPDGADALIGARSGGRPE
jgi:Trypsin-co-occurring domain 2